MKVNNLHRAWIVTPAIIATLVAVPLLVQADEAADRKAEAEELFMTGQAALDSGDNAKGCELMRKSMTLFAVANSLFHVAQCDERDGKLALAIDHWKRGNSLIDETDKRFPVVKKAIEDLEVRAPRLRIVVPLNDEPVEVLLDDELVQAEKREAAFFIDPGKHNVTVRKEGHEDWHIEIVLNERERTEVVAKLGTALPAPSLTASDSALPPPPPPPRGPSPLKLGGFVAIGVGAAGFIGAVITSGVIRSQHEQIISECPQKSCTSKGLSLIDSQETLLPLNAVFWGAGIAGAAAGTVMLVMASRKTKEDKTPTVAPLILTRGGGIGLSGRF